MQIEKRRKTNQTVITISCLDRAWRYFSDGGAEKLEENENSEFVFRTFVGDYWSVLRS